MRSTYDNLSKKYPSRYVIGNSNDNPDIIITNHYIHSKCKKIIYYMVNGKESEVEDFGYKINSKGIFEMNLIKEKIKSNFTCMHLHSRVRRDLLPYFQKELNTLSQSIDGVPLRC